MDPFAGLPPLRRPKQGASVLEWEDYYRLEKAWSDASKSAEELCRAIGWIVGVTALFGVSFFAYWAYEIRSEKHLRIEFNKNSIQSCINRGGYVVEYPNGFIKECRGVQRAP